MSRDQRRRAAPWESDGKRWWVAGRYDLDTSVLASYLQTVPQHERQIPNITLQVHAKGEAPFLAPRYLRGDVGHGWVEFVLPTGEKEALGFWPAAEARGEDVSMTEITIGVPGAVIKDWSTPRQSAEVKITAEDLERSLQYVAQHVDAEYVLTGPGSYNCITFSREIFKIATGKKFPGSLEIPNFLAKDIAKFRGSRDSTP